MRIALGIEYDGAPFCGWQSQPSGCGVQDHVERAIASFVAGDAFIGVTCAGRTDAGVHALEQVVHFDVDADRAEMAWVRGVNRFLPDAIRVLWMHPVPDTFHARFSARSRSYQYLLLADRTEPALLHARAGWFHQLLDVNAMRAAARILEGEHDFSAFRSAECQAKSPVKTIHTIAITEPSPFIRFDLRANAFLHHMVRNIVGALVYVGAGRLTLDQFAAVLASRDRRHAPPTFAASGLYLSGIEYDASFALPQRAPRAPWLN
ncbi:MAG: tRNA pseudouridine(38-40) synthase TruA [Betaproteobacteria bacterium]|nr:tRNA pseudouridine(38-40) synthase TruA [Betaproteobacteria bacterium]